MKPEVFESLLDALADELAERVAAKIRARLPELAVQEPPKKRVPTDIEKAKARKALRRLGLDV